MNTRAYAQPHPQGRTAHPCRLHPHHRKEHTLKVHPFADTLPMLDQDELHDLAESIKTEGLHHPIVLDPDGVLVDGRNRLAACKIAGVEPASPPTTAIRSA
ncbi:ParB N-terminal domain-containing protein [Streptomyces sp. NPDC097617]|uniref:ParB N-terminal domain-containing protein n=1 Tax=Streptomyces sp. NPDC097617 TaxID=3366091 RepID=UPI00380B3C6E